MEHAKDLDEDLYRETEKGDRIRELAIVKMVSSWLMRWVAGEDVSIASDSKKIQGNRVLIGSCYDLNS